VSGYAYAIIPIVITVLLSMLAVALVAANSVRHDEDIIPYSEEEDPTL
jgi:hypothetical protein